MVCAPVRSIIPSLKLGDYLSVQAHKPCSISHQLHICKLIKVKPSTISVTDLHFLYLFLSDDLQVSAGNVVPLAAYIFCGFIFM